MLSPPLPPNAEAAAASDAESAAASDAESAAASNAEAAATSNAEAAAASDAEAATASVEDAVAAVRDLVRQSCELAAGGAYLAQVEAGHVVVSPQVGILRAIEGNVLSIDPRRRDGINLASHAIANVVVKR
jgi:hypothetical protein